MTRLLGLINRRQPPVRARGVHAAYGVVVVGGERRAYKDLSVFPVCGGSIRPLASQRARREPARGPKA